MKDELTLAYERMGHLVRARCRRILHDDSAADDAMQECFVRLLRSIESYRAATSKLAWIYRVSDRCCFDVLARRRTRREDPMPARGIGEVGSGAQAMEDRELVLAFLDRFDERTQEIAVMHYLDELSQDEIGAAVGWSRQTVHKKLVYLKERAAALRSLYTEARAS